MERNAVAVPAALLLDKNLSDGIKLLWITWSYLSRGDLPVTHSLLRERTALSRETVRYGLAQLTEAGWLPNQPTGGTSTRSKATAPPAKVVDPSVAIPIELLRDSEVGSRAKLAYGCLQLINGFKHGSGVFTYPALQQLLGGSIKRIRPAVRELSAHGWLEASRRSQMSPIQYKLLNPVLSRREAEISLMLQRLNEAKNFEEALMQAYLSLLVNCDEFEDNARPGFLVNPSSGERMEFDRYYPPKVAFEYNGQQHYRTTALVPEEAKVRNQKMRDLLKAGICSNRGITLVVVHKKDLSLTKMRQKVAGLLPLRDLEGYEEMIAFLDRMGRTGRADRPGTAES